MAGANFKRYKYTVASWNQGEKHAQSKLREWEIKLIRQERAELKTSYKLLADKYQTSITNIFNIVQRNSWKHI